MFIVFEGLDGSGSSTQVGKLFEYFESVGKSVLKTKEPTTGVIGSLARDVLTGKIKISNDSLQLLFCADRANHINELIKPALDKGKIVISDRYYFSTIAFGSLGCDREWLEEINRNFLKPDIIFLFKLDPKECIKRIEKRGTQKELFEKEQILKEVWKTYEYLSTKYDNCIVIDASKGIEDIFQEVLKHLGV